MEENKISLCLRFKRNFFSEYHHPKTKTEFELHFYLSTFNFPLNSVSISTIFLLHIAFLFLSPIYPISNQVSRFSSRI